MSPALAGRFYLCHQESPRDSVSLADIGHFRFTMYSSVSFGKLISKEFVYFIFVVNFIGVNLLMLFL